MVLFFPELHVHFLYRASFQQIVQLLLLQTNVSAVLTVTTGELVYNTVKIRSIALKNRSFNLKILILSDHFIVLCSMPRSAGARSVISHSFT